MLILRPTAVERIESYDPAWPLPKLFRLKKKGKLDRWRSSKGATINTPSMLATEDSSSRWNGPSPSAGGEALFARADANAAAVQDFMIAHGYLRNMAADPAQRTNTGVCMVFQGDWYESLSPEAAG